jgi:hypothetical protein
MHIEIPTPTRDEATRWIGGWVERVFPKKTPGLMFLRDEAGLLKKLPINLYGCALYGPGSPIAGDIIVMSRREAAEGDWL